MIIYIFFFFILKDVNRNKSRLKKNIGLTNQFISSSFKFINYEFNNTLKQILFKKKTIIMVYRFFFLNIKKFF